MTTHSGRQYTLSSPVVPIAPMAPPKWSPKELFGPLDLANTLGGLHDLPSKVDSWIPRFSGEEGPYGNSHWTKFCEGFEFHQSGQEHPNIFMRLFASSLIGTAKNWSNTQPSGSFKTPEDLNELSKRGGVKKKV